MRTLLATLLAMLLLPSVALAQGLPIKGGASSDLAGVDTNKNLNVVPPATIAATGFVKMATQDGLGPTTSGAFSGTPGTSATKNRLKVGQDSLILYDPFDGTALNVNLWSRSFNTTAYAFTVSTSGLAINSGAVSTANTNLAIFSPRMIPRVTTFPMVFRAIARTPNQNITCGGGSCSGRADNAWAELGVGTYATMTTSAVAAVTDGAFFRWTSSGLTAVAVFNGTEATSALSQPDTNYHSFMIARKATSADFYIDDVLAATITRTAGNPSMVSTSRLAVLARVLDNTASTSSLAPQLTIGELIVFEEDNNKTKSWGEQLSGTGRGSSIDPTVTGTYLQSAAWVNNTAPGSCTGGNVALDANCLSTLGGNFLLTSTAAKFGIVAEWDGLVDSYTVPAGFALYVTRIRIDAYISTAITTATTTLVCWGAATNSTADSLATTDAAPTSGVAQVNAPRRLPVGCQTSTAVTAGTPLPVLDVSYSPPLLVEPGRKFQVFARVPTTAWGAGALRGTISVNGYFE